MSLTRISIPIPKILQQIRITLVLLYRKLRWGYAFRKIELTQGQYAIVDPEDFNKLNKYKWYAHKGKTTYYAYRAKSVYENKGNKNVKMHDEVMLKCSEFVFGGAARIGVDLRLTSIDLSTSPTPYGAGSGRDDRGAQRFIIDHINGDGRDNRKANLRFADYSQNGQNRNKTKKQCASKYKGIWRDKKSGKWRAQICFRGTKKHLGYYADEKQAAKAYDRAARKYHGKFAKLNFGKKLQPRISFRQD